VELAAEPARHAHDILECDLAVRVEDPDVQALLLAGGLLPEDRHPLVALRAQGLAEEDGPVELRLDRAGPVDREDEIVRRKARLLGNSLDRRQQEEPRGEDGEHCETSYQHGVFPPGGEP
jgi:hypothetical protein